LPELRITAAEAIRALKQLGFYYDHQTGSHVIMKKQTIEGELTCIVPNHKGTMAPGTVKSIMEQAHVTRKQFIAALKG
jgi:predicted RNA binding protein YcfA (HicA-like mRNA interferase family)